MLIGLLHSAFPTKLSSFKYFYLLCLFGIYCCRNSDRNTDDGAWWHGDN